MVSGRVGSGPSVGRWRILRSGCAVAGAFVSAGRRGDGEWVLCVSVRVYTCAERAGVSCGRRACVRMSMIMASSQRFKADVRIFSILCASTKVLVLGLVFLVPMGFQYS